MKMGVCRGSEAAYSGEVVMWPLFVCGTIQPMRVGGCHWLVVEVGSGAAGVGRLISLCRLFLANLITS